jgi:hypothetical protein
MLRSMLVLSAPRLRLWPPSTLGSKPAPAGAGLDDPGDGAGIDRHSADAGHGGVASVPLARRRPDPPEEGARGDPGRLPGTAQRGSDRARWCRRGG